MRSLPEIIKSRIRSSGPITFKEFMSLALYHDEYGYYNTARTKIGRAGDYYTSPYSGSGYGRVIAGFIEKSFRVLATECFMVIEPGAGRGFLALDILDALKFNYPECYKAVNYIMIENSPESSGQAVRLLEEHRQKISPFRSIDSTVPQKCTGVIISNEFFDALPFHRLVFGAGDIMEIYVAHENNEFVEVTDRPSSLEIVDYISRVDSNFTEGQQIEVNLEAGNTLNKLAGLLDKGLILTVDYGYLAEELYSNHRMEGTYKCMYRHRVNSNPYQYIGEQDITAHVDFSNLINTGSGSGLSVLKYTTQGQFLLDWGILDIIENEPDARRRSAMKSLFLPESMGDRFKALLQSKNFSTGADFYPDSPFRISFRIL